MIHLNLLASLLSIFFTELKKNRVSRFYNFFSAASYVPKSQFSYIKPYVKITKIGIFGALIYPKRVQIGYKLDQNTNLVCNFDNYGQKCKKVKFQRNMDDFHWKISIPSWKSRFVKNHEKRKNSLPDCPIWLFSDMLVLIYNHWNKILNQFF